MAKRIVVGREPVRIDGQIRVQILAIVPALDGKQNRRPRRPCARFVSATSRERLATLIYRRQSGRANLMEPPA